MICFITIYFITIYFIKKVQIILLHLLTNHIVIKQSKLRRDTNYIESGSSSSLAEECLSASYFSSDFR